MSHAQRGAILDEGGIYKRTSGANDRAPQYRTNPFPANFAGPQPQSPTIRNNRSLVMNKLVSIIVLTSVFMLCATSATAQVTYEYDRLHRLVSADSCQLRPAPSADGRSFRLTGTRTL